jgi:hypothetical protein
MFLMNRTTADFLQSNGKYPQPRDFLAAAPQGPDGAPQARDSGLKRIGNDSSLPIVVVVAFCLVVFLSCSSGTQWIKPVQMESFFNASVAVEKQYPDAGAVVLLDEAIVEVFPRSEHSFSEYLRHTVVKIRNERGLKYANILIPYDNNSRVEGIKARVILPDGKTVTLSKDEIFDTSLYPEFLFYSDDRARRFTVPGVEEGCLVETEWRKTIDNFSFWTRWDFQHADPVLISRYTVRCPNDWEIRWKTYGIELKPEVESLPKGMKANHTWKAENLPPFREEAAMPPGDGNVAHLMFSSVGVKSWGDIASWYLRVCEGRMNPDKAIRSKTAELTAGVADPREKLKRIFEFVRDRIRYIAIEIGEGGYQPHDAPSVFRKRYGDCKDMTALIVAMAGATGITTHPVLISTWQNGDVDTSLVSQAQFNHAIAVSDLPDGSAVWMDATEKTCAFGDLPWYDRDRLVFVVKDDSLGTFIRTPRPKVDDSRLSRTWDLSADSTGCGRGSVCMVFTGVLAGEMRHQLRRMPDTAIRNWIGRQLLYRFPGVVCDSIRLEDLWNPENPLRLSASFDSAKWMVRDGGSFSFRPGEFALYDMNYVFPEKERRYPIALQYPMSVQDTVLIRHPVQWSLVSETLGDSASAPFGDYGWQACVQEAGRFLYKRRIQFGETVVENSHYSEFRAFVNRVAQGDRAEAVFRENP